MEIKCSEEEFRIFERIAKKEDCIGSFLFCLGLVLLGKKPGTTPAVRDEVENYEKEIKQMGCSIKRLNLEFVDFDSLPGYAKEMGADKPYFIARKPERLEMLKESYSDRQKYERDFALFLGYPREDVEWFINQTDRNHGEAYEKSKEKLGDPQDFEEVVSSVFYVPKPTEECYKRARETAVRYKKAFRKADKRFDSDVGKKLIEMQLN